MLFETVWPEGVVRSRKSFDGKRTSFNWEIQGMRQSDKKTGIAHSIQDVLDAVEDIGERCLFFLYNQEDLDQNPHHYNNISSDDIPMAIALLCGKSKSICVRSGNISPTLDESMILFFVERVLMLSSADRLVGTWRDGTPVEDGEILFHVV